MRNIDQFAVWAGMPIFGLFGWLADWPNGAVVVVGLAGGILIYISEELHAIRQLLKSQLAPGE